MRAPNDFPCPFDGTEEEKSRDLRADDEFTNAEKPTKTVQKSPRGANRRRSIPGPWPLESTKSREPSELPTIDELRYYRSLAAKIVKEHGEIYLPIFRRLHEEIERREADNEAIESALKYADSP